MNQSHYRYDDILSLSWGFIIDIDNYNLLLNKLEILFSDYLHYPRYEWQEFGIFPPDATLKFAWRDKTGEIFIFLLEDSLTNNYIVNCIGTEIKINSLVDDIEQIKSMLNTKISKGLNIQQNENKIDKFEKSNVIKNSLKIIGLPTAAFNVLSVSLRLLPNIEFENTFWEALIIHLLFVIHSIAYLFLIIFMLLILFIGLKYLIRIIKTI